MPFIPCEEGEARCSGDAREVCVDGAFVGSPCAADQQCSDGACVCVVGDERCVDGARERCDGDAFAPDPCPAEKPFCFGDGACTACMPGEARCTPSGRERCGEDGSWSADPCAASFPECWGDGGCRLCEPGVPRCAATGEREVCASDGTAWMDDGCPGTSPLCVDGQCQSCDGAPPVCAAAVLSVRDEAVFVEPWLGGETTWPLNFFAVGFASALETIAGDVDGDEVTDLVLVRSARIDVKRGVPATFAPDVTFWLGLPSTTVYARRLADFDGDGDDDLAEWGSSGVRVWRSLGMSFEVPTLWTPDFGALGDTRLAADFDGDGLADLLSISESGALVALSAGASFGSPTLWLAAPPSASKGYLVGDLDGDGDADLVAFQDSAILVALADSGAFQSPTDWSSGMPNMEALHATHALDFDSDGRVDVVWQNFASLFWMRSTGAGLDPPVMVGHTPFLGDFGNHSGRVCMPGPQCGP
ncbi:MAG: FG-GAP-like repeat-containing protein [Polyangiaceae bacterium]